MGACSATRDFLFFKEISDLSGLGTEIKLNIDINIDIIEIQILNIDINFGF